MNSDPALPLAVQTIVGFEAFRSHAYLDSNGVPTIGYGFTYTEGGRHVMMTDGPISEPQAMTWLTLLVASVLVSVRLMVHVQVTDNQASALASLAYNCGCPAIRASTLIRLLNAGELVKAAAQFLEWDHDNGKVVKGLLTRRKVEMALFQEPDVRSNPTKPS